MDCFLQELEDACAAIRMNTIECVQAVSAPMSGVECAELMNTRVADRTRSNEYLGG